MLTSWRSEIGKTGISVVQDLWNSNTRKYGRDEQHKKYARKHLSGLNYMYEFLAGRPVSVILLVYCHYL